MKLVVFSSKRSTHHAFIESLIGHRPHFYENNVRFRELDGIQTKEVGKVSGHWFAKPISHVASFEMDYDFEKLIKHEFFVEYKSFRKLAFLRSPMNTLASTMSIFYSSSSSSIFHDEHWVRRNMEQWCNLADAVVSGGNQFHAAIYADRLWTDSAYRNFASKLLGARINPKTTLSRFAGGGGSWIDESGIDFQNLTQRWHIYRHDSLFMQILEENRKSISSFLENFDREELENFNRLNSSK